MTVDDPGAKHLVAFTTKELEAIVCANMNAWDKTPGLTAVEQMAVQRVRKKLRTANLRAQTKLKTST